jgi:hypothetical protein
MEFKMMGFRDAIRFSQEIFHRYLKSDKPFPESTWITVSEGWDLNLWADGGLCHGTLYRVANTRNVANTDTIPIRFGPIEVGASFQKEEAA